jgi:hypothetical protein
LGFPNAAEERDQNGQGDLEYDDLSSHGKPRAGLRLFFKSQMGIDNK